MILENAAEAIGIIENVHVIYRIFHNSSFIYIICVNNEETLEKSSSTTGQLL